MERCNISEPGTLARASRALRAGGLVAVPTDTVYGVAAAAFDGVAVAALYGAKQRPLAKAIPVLVADASALELVAIAVPATAQRLAAAFWPGALTLVLGKHAAVPEQVSAGPTVAVRVPAHAWLLQLLAALGPLAVTSANLSGTAALHSADAVAAQLGAQLAVLVDAGELVAAAPSTIVDCTVEPPVILRQGAISSAAVRAACYPA
jgi:L-threonylcarbamoyladenylate synthase